eukprot:scaffold3984_cov87-Cylindrotheca_fusiformis.AAC.1
MPRTSIASSTSFSTSTVTDDSTVFDSSPPPHPPLTPTTNSPIPTQIDITQVPPPPTSPILTHNEITQDNSTHSHTPIRPQHHATTHLSQPAITSFLTTAGATDTAQPTHRHTELPRLQQHRFQETPNNQCGDPFSASNQGAFTTDHFRIWSNNINSIGVSTVKPEFRGFCHDLAPFGIDIMALQETNLNTGLYSHRMTVKSILQQEFGTVKMITACTPLRSTMAYKPGGVLLAALGDCAHR